ncbi:hypothetical protein KAU32_06975 [bacterium]|nr:hypothetical protein [bacterium]
MVDNNKLVNVIKGNPYWRVIIRPLKYNADLLSFNRAKKIIIDSAINLRGWQYPAFHEHEIINKENYIEGKINWSSFNEYWRFYQSGQFIHLFNLQENLRLKNEGKVPSFLSPTPKEEPLSYISIISTIYLFVEIFEFAIRITEEDIYNSGVYMSVQLNKCDKMRLFSYESSRIFFKSYMCESEKINIEISLGKNIILTEGREICLEKVQRFFEYFQWGNFPEDLIREEQKKLLERRI